LNEILDVRTFIHDIYWIRAFLRETVVLSDESKINEDDPYIIYEINSSENNKYPYYYDKHNDKRYSKPMM
jgi:Uma2 family endonuclease